MTNRGDSKGEKGLTRGRPHVIFGRSARTRWASGAWM